MPHLLAQWLHAARGRGVAGASESRWCRRPTALGTPFDWLHPGDGVRYVSFADWLCPTHCIEPATCPVIGAPRTWEMGEAVAAWTDGAPRRAPHRRAGTLHLPPHGAWCRDVSGATRLREDFAALATQTRAATPDGADLVVGSVSACHGAVGVLRVTR